AGMLALPLAGKAAWIAAAIILTFTVVQSMGLREGALVQQATSTFVCLAFAFLVGACLWSSGAGHLMETARRPAPVSLFGALILAMQSVFVTYDGWYMPTYFVEEDRDPARNLPRQMRLGVLLIAAIYLLVNIALLVVLPFDELAGSELPVAAAMKHLFGAGGGTLLTLLLLAAVLPLVNAATLSSTRILFGLSRDILRWTPGQRVTQSGTPIVALWVSTAASLLFLLSGTYERLLGIAGLFYVAMYCATFVSLFLMRIREPDAPRPYRVPLYPWTPAFVLVCGMVYLAGVLREDPLNSGLALLLIAAAMPAYLAVRRLQA
ncbi:MAG: APC family permease, partial [Bryobacteraceae bacterium]